MTSRNALGVAFDAWSDWVAREEAKFEAWWASDAARPWLADDKGAARTAWLARARTDVLTLPQMPEPDFEYADERDD